MAPRVFGQSWGPGVVPGCQTGNLSTDRMARVPCTASQSRSNIPVDRRNFATRARYKMEVCRIFRSTGSCAYGDSCIFAHGLEEERIVIHRTSGGSGNVTMYQNVVNQDVHKPGCCKFYFYKGGCPYGNRCIFQHQRLNRSEKYQDVSQQGSVISIESSDKNIESYYKTRMCHKWGMYKACPYGVHCHYAHGEAELRQRHSAGSESVDRWIVQRASTKDVLPDNAMGRTDACNLQQKVCLLNWKTARKMIGVYADWIEEEPHSPCSPSKQ